MNKIGPLSRIQTNSKQQSKNTKNKENINIKKQNSENQAETNSEKKSNNKSFGAYNALINSHNRARKNAIRKQTENNKAKKEIAEDKEKEAEIINEEIKDKTDDELLQTKQKDQPEME